MTLYRGAGIRNVRRARLSGAEAMSRGCQQGNEPSGMRNNLEILFGAPLLRIAWTDVEDLNRDLKAIIVEKRRTVSSVAQSNRGGWQSSRDLQTWGTAPVDRFLRMANQAVTKVTRACIGVDVPFDLTCKWTLVAWANVNRFSHYNGLHNHAGGFWSGVYYVSAGFPRSNSPYEGSITFRNPSLAPLASSNLNIPSIISDIFRPKHTVQPIDGLMLVFPSWLEHYVHPYFGRRSRISISWDVRFSSDGPAPE